MAQAAFSTPYTPTAYITAADFKNAAVAVNYKDLIPGGTTAQNDAALNELIRQASGWADSICNQVMGATVDIEAKQVRPNRRGDLIIHPDNWPILEVRDMQWGTSPQRLISLQDLTTIWIEPQLFTVSASQFAATDVGPLEFGAAVPGQSLFVRYAYVNGWPVTTLTAAPSAGASTITVADATGIYGGASTRSATAATPPATVLTLYGSDFSKTEQVSVASVAGNVLTLNSALVYGHSIGDLASALPPQVRRAVALLTAALIKTRGDDAIVMGQMTPSRKTGSDGAKSAYVDQATMILEQSFRRVR